MHLHAHAYTARIPVAQLFSQDCAVKAISLGIETSEKKMPQNVCLALKNTLLMRRLASHLFWGHNSKDSFKAEVKFQFTNYLLSRSSPK